MIDTKALADALFVEVEKYVGSRVSEIASAMESLETRIKELSEREPVHGKDGKDGVDGKDGAPGIDGKDGIDGVDGKDGIDGKDGTGIDGKDGAPGIDGEKGLDGRDGRDGEPGRDAVHIDVLDGIDPAKKYQRGTFAYFRGGMVRSFRATDPLPVDGELEKCGWHVVVSGISKHEIDASEDLRTFTVRSVMTDGRKSMATLRSPALIYRGIWKEQVYMQGDTVTRDGSSWIAKRDNVTSRPPSDDWQLAVRKGRDGSDK